MEILRKIAKEKRLPGPGKKIRSKDAGAPSRLAPAPACKGSNDVAAAPVECEHTSKVSVHQPEALHAARANPTVCEHASQVSVQQLGHSVMKGAAPVGSEHASEVSVLQLEENLVMKGAMHANPCHQNEVTMTALLEHTLPVLLATSWGHLGSLLRGCLQ